MSSELHKAAARQKGPVHVAIVTVSDTRTPETDKNALYLRPAIEAAGHIVSAYRLIKDEPLQVASVLEELCADGQTQVMFWNGGTGISPRDTTFDVLSRMLDKTLPGFGEIFDCGSRQRQGRFLHPRISQRREARLGKTDPPRTRTSRLGS